jgi:hypothetical protein
MFQAFCMIGSFCGVTVIAFAMPKEGDIQSEALEDMNNEYLDGYSVQ